MIKSIRDISSEMNSLEAELKENESMCLDVADLIGLMKRQNVPK